MRNSFEQFLDVVDIDNFAKLAAHQLKRSPLELRVVIATAVAEARVMVALLSEVTLGVDQRILEVGCGVGLVSAFLASQGHRVFAVEPGDGDWQLYPQIARILVDTLHSPLILSSSFIESLSRSNDLTFDFIFSNNVLEHLPNPASTLAQLHRMLSPGGRMVHHCPNYHVPFEPHLGIPLIPCFPSVTTLLLRSKVATSPLWRSLNFITASRVRNASRTCSSSVSFWPGISASTVRRLVSDKEFRSRHPFLGRLIELLGTGIVCRIVDLMPPSWMTPMVFTWHKATRT